MNYLNKLEFKYNNIPEWHRQGYKGKNIKVANLEQGNCDAWNLKDRIVNPFDMKREGTNHHGDNVMDVILQVAPECKIHMLNSAGYSTPNGGFEGDFMSQTLPYIEKNNIHLVNASLSGTNNQGLANEINKIKRATGTTFITGAGNESKFDAIGYSSENGWITIGASHLNSKGDIYIASYSSRGHSIDFTQFSSLYVNNQKYPGDKLIVTGTSFSSPMMTGMFALVQDFFLSNTGKTLNQEQLYQFALDNVVDLGDLGKDNLYGHGIFVLPEPEDINVNKYIGRTEEDTPKETIPEKIIDKEEIKVDFKDVDKNRWSKEDIDLVSKFEVMQGYEGGTFRPKENITREEVAAVAANLIRLFNNK